MIFGWWARRRRLKRLAKPVPEAWATLLERDLEHWSRLTDDDRARLLDIARVLMAEKRWEGCGGLDLTETMRLTLAVQAGTLLLGLDHDYYRNVQSVLVYPHGYELPQRHEMGILAPSQRAVLGHAQLRGPVVLSWRSALAGGRDADDGRNLVYHEFAHKLDMLDGAVDGTPPMGDRRALARWIAVMTEAYESLKADAARGRASLLDHYGATDVAEFFACATETFFEKPRQMEEKAPALYGVLRGFYGQHPASWRR
jgi:Mlc titration factor MtfA (ptsG expression regulator)